MIYFLAVRLRQHEGLLAVPYLLQLKNCNE